MPLLSRGTVHAMSTRCQCQPRANNALQKSIPTRLNSNALSIWNGLVSEALSLHILEDMAAPTHRAYTNGAHIQKRLAEALGPQMIKVG